MLIAPDCIRIQSIARNPRSVFRNGNFSTCNFIEERAFERLNAELKWFCDKHDYRNRLKPMGTSADILPRMSEKLYGKKIED
jgi:hypothetical protein